MVKIQMKIPEDLVEFCYDYELNVRVDMTYRQHPFARISVKDKEDTTLVTVAGYYTESLAEVLWRYVRRDLMIWLEKKTDPRMVN